jgi:hypothetical protein
VTGRHDLAIFDRTYGELVQVEHRPDIATPPVGVGGGSQYVTADTSGNVYLNALPGSIGGRGLIGNAGAPIIPLSERLPHPYTALAVAQGLVAVPATNRITVFG